MSEDEFMILLIAGVAAAVTAALTSRAMLPALVFRQNAGPGLLRLSVVASMGWIFFVLLWYSDPSVQGSSLYILFYLVIGYAVIKLFGQGAVTAFGLRPQIDVYERRNLPAALFIAAFTLGTGLIYGASNWGEADPVGEGEGGWWIPLGFFLMGWLVFVGALGLYVARESWSFSRRILQDRSLGDARAASAYLLGISVIVSEAVAGDFFGWLHGVLGLAIIVVMIVAHEFLAAREDPTPTTAPEWMPTTGRVLESLVYLALSASFWLAHRWVNAWTGASGS